MGVHLDVGMGSGERRKRLPIRRGDLLVPQSNGDHGLAAGRPGRDVQQHRRRRPATQRPALKPVRTAWKTVAAGSFEPRDDDRSHDVPLEDSQTTRSSGTIATTVAAITSVHWALYRDCSAAVATVSTCHLVPLVITNGHMKWCHCDTTVISISVTRTGRLDGSTTCTMTSSVLAPSRYAALIRSSGIARKYWRRRKIA